MENKLKKALISPLKLDDFDFQQKQKEREILEQQFTPLQAYIDEQKERREKEKISKINRMKEILDFKEK